MRAHHRSPAFAAWSSRGEPLSIVDHTARGLRGTLASLPRPTRVHGSSNAKSATRACPAATPAAARSRRCMLYCKRAPPGQARTGSYPRNSGRTALNAISQVCSGTRCGSPITQVSCSRLPQVAPAPSSVNKGPRMKRNRRHFLSQSAALTAGGLLTPYIFTAGAAERNLPRSSNDQFGIGAIGMRYQGSVITEKARPYGPIVAIADVDRHVREQARASFGSTPAIFEDYRSLLERKDVDVVLIATPDHWHTQMLIDACRAGKDVYIEKPLTLTIDEGKLLRNVVKETGRVVQVGSWQRSDWQFRLAVELVRAGRLGQLRKVSCITGPNPSGGPFVERPVPGHLNWDLWQGQTPAVPYIEERCHYTFRWWYEYSGGKVTDWGAHDIDIAQWAINELPIAIEGEADLPQIPNGYNVATRFHAVVRYPSGTLLEIGDTGRQGTLFEGDQGRIFVNRGVVSGVPVEQLPDNPLPRERYQAYDFDDLERPNRTGKLDAIVNHMANFFDCVRQRRQPISDVESQHRSVSTCHLANIAMRLGRPLQWDPQHELFVGDDEANQWLRREQRKNFEIA